MTTFQNLSLIFLTLMASASILLALFVYKNNPKSATNRILSTLNIIFCLWMIVNHLSIQPMFLSNSLTLIRLSIFFATPMSFFFYLLAKTTPDKEIGIRPLALISLSVITALTMLITLSPFAFTTVTIINNTPKPTTGPGMLPFSLVTTLFSVVAIITLFRKLRVATGIKKQQLLYVTMGTLLMLGLIISTVLIPVILFKISLFVGLIPVYTLIFLLMTSYAIVKHRLLDIRMAVARGTAYVLLLMIIAVFYVLFFLFLGSKFFNLNFSVTEAILYGLITFGIAITFQPIRRLIEATTVNIFYRDHYDTSLLLHNLTQIMASTLALGDLMHLLLKEMVKQMHINGASLFLIENGKIYTSAHEGPELKHEADTNKVLKLISQNKSLFFDELAEDDLKQIMRDLDLSLAIPLRAKGNTIGLLALGNKLSGDLYTNEDIRLLEIVAPEAAVATQNAIAYEQIRLFNIRLKDEVDKATKDLQAANERLKELDKMKDEFVSIASHELRTPMTAIKSYLWLFLQDQEAKLNGKDKLYIEHAYTATDRLITLVNDMLNISRIESGRMSLFLQPTSIVQTTNEVISELLPAAEKAQVVLSATPPPDNFPQVIADTDKIREVLINLIGNALKFTPPNGQVTVSYSLENDKVVVKIKDSGKGISKEDLAKLFHKFQTVGNNYLTKMSIQGTGLGLYLSKSIISLHGGNIWVESEGENKGATFYFSLKTVAGKQDQTANAHANQLIGNQTQQNTNVPVASTQL